MILAKPMFAFLDEATSAVTEAFEEWLFVHCKKSGISLITISHKSSLKHYHDILLHVRRDGLCTVTNV
jgi:ABC-type uncharacterized transport system fused permease/ATPase subunit